MKAIDRETALAIRDAYESGANCASVAARFGVSSKSVSSIINGQHTHTRGLPSLVRQPRDRWSNLTW